MIIRIVKMTFVKDRVPQFLANFERNKTQIRGFEGCTHLELLRDIESENIFFTYSWWENEQALENYRHSRLFAEVWTFTKTLFAGKPQAWSLEQQVKL